MNDKISVVITTYNRIDILKKAIDSVVKQNFSFFELIVVDDCSSDNTEKVILKDYKFIKYIKNLTNLGVSACRNIGVQCAKGDIIAFLDDDDEWEPNKLMISINEMKKGDYEYVFTQFFRDEKIYPNHYDVNNNTLFESTLAKPNLSPSTLMCKKACLLELGGFNEKIKCFEDYELSLRLAKNKKGYFIPLALTKASVSENSLSSNINALEGLKTRIRLFVEYHSYIKRYGLEKEWLKGLTYFEYFTDYNEYKKLIKLVEEKMNYDLSVQREYVQSNSLDRLEQVNFFDKFDKPFWSITTEIDITNLVRYCKKNNNSFYATMTYIILKACSNIHNFRLRKENGYIFDYKELYAYFTVINEKFNVDYSSRIGLKQYDKFVDEFNKLKIEAQNGIFPQKNINIYDNVIYVSCIPWKSFSNFEPVINKTNGSYDCIPRITWDKYRKKNDTMVIDISFTVNHIFIDGYHISILLDEIKKQIDCLTNLNDY